jgi:hypothetical protein
MERWFTSDAPLSSPFIDQILIGTAILEAQGK